MPGRDLGLQGMPNARDLGGYPAGQDKSVREGMLLRAEALTDATRGDLEKLHDLGVGLVVDLRGDAEIRSFGEGPWTGERKHLPTADITQAVFAEMMGTSPGGEPIAEEELVKIMVEMYRRFVADENSRTAFADAVAVIAERTSAGTPVLVHCTAGKDRTGWLAAVVLTALGVERRRVFEDYLLTNERAREGRGAESRARLIATLRKLVGEHQPIAPLLDVRREYLQAAFDEVEARHGSMEAFLHDILGADVERLRAALLV